MVMLGVAFTAAAVVCLAVLFWKAPKAEPFALYGLVGLAIIGVAEILLFGGVEWVSTFFHANLLDRAISSRWTLRYFAFAAAPCCAANPRPLCGWPFFPSFCGLFSRLTTCSCTTGFTSGLPSNELIRYIGYGWSFATIWPGVLETTDFLLATLFRGRGPAPGPPEPRKSAVPWILLGMAMLTFPLVAPFYLQAYLFALVWLGFIGVADPLNYRARRPSLWGDLTQGYRARLWALLLAGFVCGILWEFWNYWASAKWLYIFPILEQYRVFEMPVLGFLGFPAFALEIFTMYVFAVSVLDLELYEVK